MATGLEHHHVQRQALLLCGALVSTFVWVDPLWHTFRALKHDGFDKMCWCSALRVYASGRHSCVKKLAAVQQSWHIENIPLHFIGGVHCFVVMFHSLLSLALGESCSVKCVRKSLGQHNTPYIHVAYSMQVAMLSLTLFLFG